MSSQEQGRIVGVVIKRTGRNHIIQDAGGLIHFVESDKHWADGSRVIALDGVIIGSAGAARKTKIVQQ